MPTSVVHSYDRVTPVYAPGETIRLTVEVQVEDPPPLRGRVITRTIVVMPDGTSSEPIEQESEYMVDAPAGVASSMISSDSSGRAWKQVGFQGNVAVFTTVA